ncbi:hypothetical protein [Olsenella sp. Marseille-P4559]|uniref:hypothetical protein n=1 Tax=Olsenella sp. Marseille-P4559 TaxID=2364795 RepID=UPI001031062E|nr:hypothetical protein [Olsenella sp. Marseille-P4559]
MRTTTKTIGITKGLTNGNNVHRRPTPRASGRYAEGFLSQSCERYGLPEKRSKRTAGTRTLTSQNRYPRFDEPIITPLDWLKKGVLYAFTVLTITGILPMAVAVFQIPLMDVYGDAAFLAAMGFDAALFYAVVRYVNR